LGYPQRRTSNSSRWLPAIQFKISCLLVFLLPPLRLHILILLSPRGPRTKESSSPALPSTRLQPPLPAPTSAPAADVCDHTVLPHPRSPFLSYLFYATLNNHHNTRSLLQRFGGMLTPRPWNPPHRSSKPKDCWPTCSARGNKG